MIVRLFSVPAGVMLPCCLWLAADQICCSRCVLFFRHISFNCIAIMPLAQPHECEYTKYVETGDDTESSISTTNHEQQGCMTPEGTQDDILSTDIDRPHTTANRPPSANAVARIKIAPPPLYCVFVVRCIEISLVFLFCCSRSFSSFSVSIGAY